MGCGEAREILCWGGMGEVKIFSSFLLMAGRGYDTKKNMEDGRATWLAENGFFLGTAYI